MISLIKRVWNKFFPKKYNSQIEYWEDRAKNYGVRSVIHLGHTEEELEKVTAFQIGFLFPLYQKILSDGSGNIILDFGCGPGRFSGKLAEFFQAQVIGVDPIKKLIDLAPAAANVEYRLMAEGIIPLEENSVDSVFICLVFGSITDSAVLTKTVSEIERVLKPGGSVFLVEKTSEDLSNFQTKTVEFYTNLFSFASLVKIDQYTDIVDCNSVFTGKKAL